MSDEYDENGISAHGAYDGPEEAPLLRDNLGDVPDPMRSLILSRLDFGEKKYRKALRMGWDKASVAAMEEALDGFSYARLAGNERAAEYFRLAFESLETSIRCSSPSSPTTPRVGLWSGALEWRSIGTGATEAEALVAALEAAEGREVSDD